MTGKQHVLVLQHFKENPPGRVGNILDEHNIPYTLVEVGHDQMPNPVSYGAIIALGGTQHLYDKSKYPYTVREEAYLHHAIREHMPYLGMCLGGQLLANAFQAPIQKLPKLHVGFLQIHFTTEGEHDPIYAGLPGHQQAFQWHEDAFQLPHGAVPLAHHQDGSNQSFRYLEHAYGIQYHIEITREMFDTWLGEPSLKKEFVNAYGVERYDRTVQEVAQLYPLYDSQARMMIENFLRLSKLMS
jgi:GMP synthase-like glutamine amidotransferase